MTIKKLLILILITFFIVISLSACLGEPQSNSAKIIISFGGANRAVYNPNDFAILNKLEHKIVLKSEAETLIFTAAGGTTFEANVAPGNWNLKVVSYLDGDVYAKGEKDVTLISGLNNETIAMYQAHLVKFVSNGGNAVQEQIIYHAQKASEPAPAPMHEAFGELVGWYDSMEEPFDFDNKRIFESITLYAKWKEASVSEGDSLGEKLDWIYNNSVDGGNYIVMVNDSESLAPRTLSYHGKSVSITLRSNDTTMKFVTLKDNNNSLFTVGSGVTLTLDSYITLEGSSTNNTSLVSVKDNGKLIMNPLSKVINNKSGQGGSVDDDICGGVYIGGTFIMNGGEISGNTANQGGGVWVTTGGTFTMNGGKISNNEAIVRWGGGGVKVSNGTFIMNGGEISSNSSLESLDGHGGGVSVGSNESDDRSTFIMNDGKIFNNTAEQGGGVFMYRGTFTMNGGEIFNNEASTWGGGVFASGKTFTMNGGKIYDNIATGQKNISGQDDVIGEGGGVNAIGNTFTMKGGEISGNTANQGGGVSVNNWGNGGTFIMTGGKISGNNKVESIDPSVYYDGGGVYVHGNATFTMTGGKISNNNASSGGGVYVEQDGTFFLKEKGEISDNTAKGGGGLNVYGTFIMEDGIITGNTAYAWSSGGVGVGMTGTFIMKGGEISKNIAHDAGGGVFVRGNATFSKSGGTITGLDHDKGNKVEREKAQIDDAGSAVCVTKPDDYEFLYRRETTAGPTVNLNSKIDQNWEN